MDKVLCLVILDYLAAIILLLFFFFEARKKKRRLMFYIRFSVIFILLVFASWIAIGAMDMTYPEASSYIINGKQTISIDPAQPIVYINGKKVKILNQEDYKKN